MEVTSRCAFLLVDLGKVRLLELMDDTFEIAELETPALTSQLTEVHSVLSARASLLNEPLYPLSYSSIFRILTRTVASSSVTGAFSAVIKTVWAICTV